MQPIKSDIIIIGAGLTGLALAYFLRHTNLKINIVEARNRVGGRIHTQYDATAAPQEMGATWLGTKHTSLIDLLEELNIGVFEQILSDRAIFEPISTSPHQLVTLPPNNAPSFRIQGGTSTLIHSLIKQLHNTKIFTDTSIQSIGKELEILTVRSANQIFKAQYVISTLPPYLLTQTIAFEPSLPSNVLAIAEQTHTWMGESIKVGLTYKNAFWRNPQLSGTIFSNVGPVPEMYDHSNVEDNRFGLKGFLNGAYFSITKAQRLELILSQLEKYFGIQALDFQTYEETVWRNEKYTFAPYQNHILPHQNNGHSIYQKTYLEGQLFIAGSETATFSPGYMEGAIRSAHYVAQELGRVLKLS